MARSNLKTLIVNQLEPIDDDGFLQSVLDLMLAYNNREVSFSPDQLAEIEARSAQLHADGDLGRPWRDSIDSIRKRIA
jgi:hypothetical protein